MAYEVLFILLHVINWDFVLTQQGVSCITPDQKRGYCIFINDCQPLLDLVRNKQLTPEDIYFLQQSNCGYDEGTPIVCCPVFSQTVPFHQIPTPPPAREPAETSVVDVTFHPRLRSLLPENCGIPDNEDKITNGEEAGLFEFPWMAALGYVKGNKTIDYLCGGTLINKRYVLTAAHCLVENRRNRLDFVRLGEFDLRTITDCEGFRCAPGVQDIGIERVIPHSRYSISDKKHDIGLIRLKEDVVFNEAVKPICLPVGRAEQTDLLDNKDVIVTGWGKTKYSIMSSILLKVRLPVVPLKKCEEVYLGSTRIFPTQICAGGKEGKDSCNGDSGGPLQALGIRSGEPVFIQYGLLSFGPRLCGAENFPGVYTRVGHYMMWILDNMHS